MRIGVLGGGNVGRALAGLFLNAGHEVMIAARDEDASALLVVPIKAAEFAELFVLAVPFAAVCDALAPLSQALSGKVVIDATNPVAADWSPVNLGDGNSAGEEVARALPQSRVVKAFNTVFADNMRSDRLVRGAGRVSCFIASDDEHAAAQVAKLASEIGFSPVVTGALAHARFLEAIAHLNIALLSRNSMNTSAAFIYDAGVA